MSSNQAVIRTQTGAIMLAPYLNTPHCNFLPTIPAMNKSFIREVLPITPRTGIFQPGGYPKFEQTRDIDMINVWLLRFTLGGITIPDGATFCRYGDNMGIAAWDHLTIKSGTQRLQTVSSFELLVYVIKCLNNTSRRNFLNLIGQGTPYERTNRSVANYEVFAPLVTALGFRMRGDSTQGLYVRGLNDFLTCGVQMNQANQLFETDTSTLPAVPASGYLQDGTLHAEGFHVWEASLFDFAYLHRTGRQARASLDCAGLPHAAVHHDVQ